MTPAELWDKYAATKLTKKENWWSSSDFSVSPTNIKKQNMIDNNDPWLTAEAFHGPTEDADHVCIHCQIEALLVA